MLKTIVPDEKLTRGGQQFPSSVSRLIITGGAPRLFLVFQTVFLLTLILLPVGLAYAQTAPYDPARQYVFGDDSPVTATHGRSDKSCNQRQHSRLGGF